MVRWERFTLVWRILVVAIVCEENQTFEQLLVFIGKKMTKENRILRISL